MNGAPVRILMIDDHRIVTDGLHLLLGGQPGMQVVGEARTLEAALALDRARP